MQTADFVRAPFAASPDRRRNASPPRADGSGRLCAGPVRGAVRVVLSALTFGFASAATPEGLVSEPSAPKTHVLFIGADLALARGKQPLPLEDVTANYLVLKSNGKALQVP